MTAILGLKRQRQKDLELRLAWATEFEARLGCMVRH